MNDTGSDTNPFEHDYHGHYNENPHMIVDVTFNEWTEALKQVLEYKLGPPIAWVYENGQAYLWGEPLDEGIKREIADACNDLENELSHDGFHSGAQTAQRTESKVFRAEIHEAGEEPIEVM